MIIGHSVTYGSGVRNFIFSFHMPLFFILSGFTFRTAENKEKLIRHFVKNFKRLLIPCFLVTLIGIISTWLLGSNTDFNSLLLVIQRYSLAILWGSGVVVYSYPAAGAIWFIFSLFWAKFIIDVFSLIFHRKFLEYILFFIGMLGISLGTNGIWLPQNFDVTLVAILFINIGMIWKKHQTVVNKYSELIFLLTFTIWFSCLYLGIYIEMASRSYPYQFLSVIEATCGVFSVCCLCKTLSQNVYVKYITVFIGIHSLLIFYCHKIDWVALFFLPNYSYTATIVLRVLVVLSVSFLIFWLRYCYQILYKKLYRINEIEINTPYQIP